MANNGTGKGWKQKQKTTAIRRDAQIETLTKMVSVLAADLVRLSLRNKVVEDVLAKKCGVTKADFQASTEAVTVGMKKPDQAGEGEWPAKADQCRELDAALRPEAPLVFTPEV